MSGRVVIFVQHEGFEPAFQAASLAVTAAAMGDEVYVIVSFGALRALLDGRFGALSTHPSHGERAAKLRAEELGALSPRDLLGEARTLGARLLACETTVRLCGFEPHAHSGALDEVMGLASIWRLTDGARVVSL